MHEMKKQRKQRKHKLLNSKLLENKTVVGNPNIRRENCKLIWPLENLDYLQSQDLGVYEPQNINRMLKLK